MYGMEIGTAIWKGEPTMKPTQNAALIEAFARAFHTEHHFCPACDDPTARRLFTDEEYAQLATTVTVLLQTLEPSFSGTPEEALLRVVDRYLVPLSAARESSIARALDRAAQTGTAQALFLGAGYSTLPLTHGARLPHVSFTVLERPSLLRDLQDRLRQADIQTPGNVRYVSAELRAPDWAHRFLRETGFDQHRRTFCALPGLAASCRPAAFQRRLLQLRALLAPGSTVVFDYPFGALGNALQDAELALARLGFRVCEHLSPLDITAQFFDAYNLTHRHDRMTAPQNVRFCTAVRKADA